MKNIIREEFRQQIEAIMFDKDFIKAGYHISETDHYENDLGLDSLDRVELIMAVEKEYDITVPDDVAAHIESVKDTIDYLEKATHHS